LFGGSARENRVLKLLQDMPGNNMLLQDQWLSRFPTSSHQAFFQDFALCTGISAHMGGALAGKKICYTVWVQIQWLEKIVYTSRFSVIFQNSQICRQITATPRRSIFHAAKSLQMPYKAQNQKITYFHKKIKNPLELGLDFKTVPCERSFPIAPIATSRPSV
jgi:hypothetical protein